MRRDRVAGAAAALGIGGPADGQALCLHPASLVLGDYEQPIEGWIGQIQSALSDEFTRCEGEHGFLIEALGEPAIEANSLPWMDGRRHKETLARIAHMAPFISVARDHGEGRVVIDGLGRAVARGRSDEVDDRLFRRAQVELAKLHRAGRRQGDPDHPPGIRDSLARGRGLRRVPRRRSSRLAGAQRRSRLQRPSDGLLPDGLGSRSSRSPTGAASCTTSKGVWIGDGSAFPTAPGVNPMISIMSLAHRTAEQILAAGAPALGS